MICPHHIIPKFQKIYILALAKLLLPRKVAYAPNFLSILYKTKTGVFLVECVFYICFLIKNILR
jgi:hypothetical protein